MTTAQAAYMRRLLCQDCNIALGKLQDNVLNIWRAYVYMYDEQ